MMERLMTSLINTITKTFFRRIEVLGEEHIPPDGPVIFAGNHPNALMDGWLLMARCGRWPVHFLANAKLWKYRILGKLLDASGAVPVYRREEHGDEADNSAAFDTLYNVIEAGNCMGIFPEGVSHNESQLTRLKTGTARIALTVAARGRADVCIIPCGLNYIHRHRFRSQVLVEFGEPIPIDETWLERFSRDERKTVHELTDHLAASLTAVTLNAPDWSTLRFVQTARRLYKPSNANLSPAELVELNRRFVDVYLVNESEPEMLEFRREVENYQARLDTLGIKDYQLRKSVSVTKAFRRLMMRSLSLTLLLPIAMPGVILYLPVAWLAAFVGERFSYEQDDVATLKVFAAISLLPILYLLAAYFIGNMFGTLWAIVAVVGLLISFSASIWVIETQASLLTSVVSILRRTRLRAEIENLQATRLALVSKVRGLADQFADPAKPRLFSSRDFDSNDRLQSDE